MTQQNPDRTLRDSDKRQPDDLAARAHAWVLKSTQAQGLPLKITDPATTDYIAGILNGTIDPTKPPRA